jgi:hypothetical protein
MAPSSQVAMGRLFEGGIAKAAIPRIGSRHVPRRGEHFNPKFSVEKALLNSRSHENELAFWPDMALSLLRKHLILICISNYRNNHICSEINKKNKAKMK